MLRAPCSAVLLPFGGGERALIAVYGLELLGATCQGRQVGSCQSSP